MHEMLVAGIFTQTNPGDLGTKDKKNVKKFLLRLYIFNLIGEIFCQRTHQVCQKMLKLFKKDVLGCFCITFNSVG